jgi:transposase
MPRPKQEKNISKAIRLLHAGKSPKEVATLCNVSQRTVQRWAQERQLDLQALESQEKALVESDPVVLSVTHVRAQVQEILEYRDAQRNFALQMGLVVQKATGVLLKAVEKLEQNPDEISARTIPQLMRAVSDCSEKISSAWSRAAGLDDLLEQLGNEPKIVTQGKGKIGVSISPQSVPE